MIRRRALSLLLMFALCLSALGFGMARGQAPAVGKIVICSGVGIVTISVDAEGRPVESHTLCPDAALAFWATTALPAPEPAPRNLPLAWRDWPQATPAAFSSAPTARRARAPPV